MASGCCAFGKSWPVRPQTAVGSWAMPLTRWCGGSVHHNTCPTLAAIEAQIWNPHCCPRLAPTSPRIPLAATSPPTCSLLRPPNPPSSPPAQVGGPGGALLRDAPGQGIWFADALVVPLVPGKERAVKSKLGAFYARKPNGARHLYSEGVPVKGGARGTELATLQVWVAA